MERRTWFGLSMIGPLVRAAAVALVFAAPTPAAAQQVLIGRSYTMSRRQKIEAD